MNGILIVTYLVVSYPKIEEEYPMKQSMSFLIAFLNIYQVNKKKKLKRQHYKNYHYKMTIFKFLEKIKIKLGR